MSSWPEQDLRERVAAGGGRVSISAEDLLGGFGLRRATPTARRNVEAWLAEAGLAVEPSLGTNGLPETVTLYDPAAPAEPAEPAATEPVAAPPPAAADRVPSPEPAPAELAATPAAAAPAP
ncbi:MAG TPA: hypothetical protein VF517_13160, partial [Thermoleophilaceae bacterium]